MRTVSEYARYVNVSFSRVKSMISEVGNGIRTRWCRGRDGGRVTSRRSHKPECKASKVLNASSYWIIHVNRSLIHRGNKSTNSKDTSFPSTVIAALSMSTSLGLFCRSIARCFIATVAAVATGVEFLPEDLFQPDWMAADSCLEAEFTARIASSRICSSERIAAFCFPFALEMTRFDVRCSARLSTVMPIDFELVGTIRLGVFLRVALAIVRTVSWS